MLSGERNRYPSFFILKSDEMSRFDLSGTEDLDWMEGEFDKTEDPWDWYIYLHLIFMGNVGKYTIRGSSGLYTEIFRQKTVLFLGGAGWDVLFFGGGWGGWGCFFFLFFFFGVG